MNCEEFKISLPHLRHQSILCWQLTCTNRVFQYAITTQNAYSTASMLYLLVLATGQQYCFGTMMEVFLPTILTTLLNRTPTLTLHRVFHLSRTTIKMMTIHLNLLTLLRHHHTFQTFLCQMILTRRILAFLLMMILFTHHFIHHHNQVMTHQMMKCNHHQVNHLIYHIIHHHHRIIHNHHFPEPMPFLLLQIPLLCPIRLYHQTLGTHQ